MSVLFSIAIMILSITGTLQPLLSDHPWEDRQVQSNEGWPFNGGKKQLEEP